MTVEGSAPVVWNILIDSIISLLSDCRPNWLSAVSLLPPTPNVDISPSLTTSHRPLLTISRPFHPSSSRPRPAAHQHQGTGYKVRPGKREEFSPNQTLEKCRRFVQVSEQVITTWAWWRSQSRGCQRRSSKFSDRRQRSRGSDREGELLEKITKR